LSNTKPRIRSLKTAVTAAVLFALLGLALYGAVTAWRALGEVQISTVGLLAMAAGILLSLLLGGGLMFLVFWSSRRGHDDLDID
jgi:TRAP-type C4-dicarboxylate transport system permease small subunit